MKPATNHPSALVVADAPGHILERIGKSWQRQASAIHHELLCSSQTHPYICCREAIRLGLVHWLDLRRFLTCSRAVPAPQVVMVHHLLENERETALKALKGCDGITTVSVRWQRQLERLTNREVQLIPNTVDTQLFTMPVKRWEARRQAKIPDPTLTLGFVGKAKADADGRKGTETLRRVLAAAREIFADICVILVGPGWETLARQIEAMGIRVIRREFSVTEETVEAYALMDVLLVTSNEEGGPCTILEAMACGVPVITSDVGHVPEVIRDGENGFIAQPEAPESYLRKINLLKTQPELRNQVIQQARLFIEQHRDERVVVPRIQFETIYEQATKHYTHRPYGEKTLRQLPKMLLGGRFTVRRVLNAIE